MLPNFVVHATLDHDVDKLRFLCVSLNHLPFFWEAYNLQRFVKRVTNMLIDDVEEPERTVDHLIENFKLGLEKLTYFRESLKEVV
jgi:hypothetical protein